MSTTLCTSLLLLGALDNVAGRIKSIILEDYNVLGLLVDAIFYLLVLGLLLAQDTDTLLHQGQIAFFFKWHNPIDEGARTYLEGAATVKPMSREFTFGRKSQGSSKWDAVRDSGVRLPDDLEERLLLTSRPSLTDDTTVSGVEVPSKILSEVSTCASEPESPPLCCIEHAFRSIANAICTMETICTLQSSRAYVRLYKWMSSLPDAKFLFLIAVLESLSFAILAIVQPVIPGPLAVSTNVSFLPWTAIMSYLCLNRPLNFAQGLGLLIIGTGAWYVTAATTAPPLPGVGPLPKVSYSPEVQKELAAAQWQEYRQLMFFLTLRILAFLPLASALIIRELLIQRYDVYARNIFNLDLCSNDSQSSSQSRSMKIQAMGSARTSVITPRAISASTPSLSVPLLSFGETAARLILAPFSVSTVFLMSGSSLSVRNLWANGTDCLIGRSTPYRDCTMAPMAYAMYLTVNLAFNLAAIAYLKHNSALKAVNMAQLIPPLTVLFYHFLPIPILTTTDRTISWELWVGIGLIMLGQYVYDTFTHSSNSSERVRPKSSSLYSSSCASDPLLCDLTGHPHAVYAASLKNSPGEPELASPSTENSPFYQQAASDWGLESAISDGHLDET